MALTLINGEPGTAWPVFDRGLQFGDGLFETMLCRDGAAIHFSDHWRRLIDGCHRLSIACPDIRDLVVHAIAQEGSSRAIAKLIVTRGSSRRGYRSPHPDCANWTLTVGEAPAPDFAVYTQGVRLRVCQTFLAPDPQFAGIKHLNRLAQVMARREWEDEFHDGLMLDHEGLVVEGCASNVFLVKAGQVVTPALKHAGVRGVVRQKVLDHCAAQHQQASVRALPLAEVWRADEVFITNSTFGVVPVRCIDEVEFSPGPVTRRVMEDIGGGIYAPSML